MNLFNPKGFFVVEHLGKNGKLKSRYKMPNGITNQGRNQILNVMFNAEAQIANNSWFIGLIDITSFVALAATDTAAQIGGSNGWNEFTLYSEANRVAWGSGTTTTQTTSNASPATFNISGGSGTVKGVFVVTNNTKTGTSGKLWATALFSADVPVTTGDQLKVTYSVTA